MTQTRWTCITTVVITTAIAPMASVYASTPSKSTQRSYQQRPVPIVTPLVVTELTTQEVNPSTSTNSLPNLAIPKSTVRFDSLAKAGIIGIDSAKSLTPPFGNRVLPQNFNRRNQVGNPVLGIKKTPNLFTPKPLLTVVPPVAPLVTIPSIKGTTLPSSPKGSQIISQATVKAKNTLLAQAQNFTTKIAAGKSTAIYDSEHPRQIIATAIAQVGNTTIVPDLDVIIPVDRPKQPTQIEAAASVLSTRIGKASWYGTEAGVMTANGERYNPDSLTAAHPSLPFGTKIRVTNLKNGKVVVVRVNDRGPFGGSRILDLSAGAAAVIDMKNDGVVKIRMEVLAKG